MTDIRAASHSPGWADLLSGSNLVRSLALSGGVALHALNLYISTTILPSVVREIGGFDYYAWNTTLFVVASILGAALSSHILALTGPRGGYGVAALIFIAGTAICASANTMQIMLAGRFVQGFGGGVLLALAYAMVRRVYPEPLWPRAMALLSSMWGIATLLGPAVGGVFAELGLWRGAFVVLIPAAVGIALSASFVLPRDNEERKSVDPLPVAQLALLTLAVFAASWGGVGKHMTSTVIGLMTALVLTGLVVVAERGSKRKLLPGGVFRLPSALGSLCDIGTFGSDRHLYGNFPAALSPGTSRPLASAGGLHRSHHVCGMDGCGHCCIRISGRPTHHGGAHGADAFSGFDGYPRCSDALDGSRRRLVASELDLHCPFDRGSRCRSCLSASVGDGPECCTSSGSGQCGVINHDGSALRNRLRGRACRSVGQPGWRSHANRRHGCCECGSLAVRHRGNSTWTVFARDERRVVQASSREIPVGLTEFDLQICAETAFSGAIYPSNSHGETTMRLEEIEYLEPDMVLFTRLHSSAFVMRLSVPAAPWRVCLAQ